MKAVLTSDHPDEDSEPTISGFITGIVSKQSIPTPEAASYVVQALRSKCENSVNTLPLPHFVFNNQIQEWKQKPPRPSPTATVSISLDRQAYKDLNLNLPELIKKPRAEHSRQRVATLDSGAQVTVINEQELSVLGIKKHSIFSLAMSVNTVTKDGIDLIGDVFLCFTYNDNSTGST